MSSNWSKTSFKYSPAYMVGGIPYVTSSQNNELLAMNHVSKEPVHISFPYITRWICIRSLDNAGSAARNIRIGFTKNGVKNNTHCIQIPDQNTPHNPGFGLTDPVLEIACTDIFLSSDHASNSTEFSLIAGLTNIPRSEYPNLTGSIDGSSNFDGVG